MCNSISGDSYWGGGHYVVAWKKQENTVYSLYDSIWGSFDDPTVIARVGNFQDRYEVYIFVLLLQQLGTDAHKISINRSLHLFEVSYNTRPAVLSSTYVAAKSFCCSKPLSFWEIPLTIFTVFVVSQC